MRRARPCRQDLVDAQLAGFETQRRAQHVEPPHALALGSDLGEGVVAVGGQVRQPVAQGQRVVVAQRLNVAHLEAGGLDDAENVARRMQLAVGKDVARDERIGLGTVGDQSRDPRG